MNQFHAVLRILHVAAGFVGLVVFWVPIFAAKGSRVHKLAGKVFVTCVAVVTVSAMISSAWALFSPDTFSSAVSSAPDAAARAEARVQVRGLGIFLGMIALASLALVLQGVWSTRWRSDPAIRPWPLLRALNLAALIGGGAALLYGFVAGRLLYSAMSWIGILVGLGNLNYARRFGGTKMGWWYGHLAGMLGGGIAFTTAFAVFGSTRLFGINFQMPWALLPWLLPSAIGIPAIRIWTRHYKKKFEGVSTTEPAAARVPGATP